MGWFSGGAEAKKKSVYGKRKESSCARRKGKAACRGVQQEAPLKNAKFAKRPPCQYRKW